MAVPPDKLGVLIGSKGAIIHDMQVKCGCKMFVKQEGIPGGLPRELIITGVPEKIEEAKALAIAGKKKYKIDVYVLSFIFVHTWYVCVNDLSLHDI